MSYDTIVQEALEPPEPRVPARRESRPSYRTRVLRRRARRMFVALVTSLTVLGGVTWMVASLSRPQRVRNSETELRNALPPETEGAAPEIRIRP